MCVLAWSREPVGAAWGLYRITVVKTNSNFPRVAPSLFYAHIVNAIYMVITLVVKNTL